MSDTKRLEMYNTYRITINYPDELYLLFDNYLPSGNPVDDIKSYVDMEEYSEEARLVTIDAILRLIHNFLHDPDFVVPNETINRIGSMLMTNASLSGWKNYIKEPGNAITTARLIKDITSAVERTLTEIVNEKYFLINVIGKLMWKIKRATTSSFTLYYYSSKRDYEES